MSVRISSKYIGDGQVELIHESSGKSLVTDLPVDNGGKGRTFSPADLLAASLSSCILTIMAKMAERDGLELRGAELVIEKEMSADPRRVGSLKGAVRLPAGIPDASRRKLLNAVAACPVHRSLHPEVRVEIRGS
ncbi:MAG: OsmC family protein [Elusimicrobiota bacterium]